MKLKSSLMVCLLALGIGVTGVISPIQAKDTAYLKTDPVDAYVKYNTNVVKFGKYEQDGNLKNGAEDIEWFKIDSPDGTKSLLVSKYCLYKTVDSPSGTWAKSSIREWLNNDFYKEAFSKKEKSKIVPSDNTCTAKEIKITNGYDTEQLSVSIYGEDTVKDNVFILSMDGVNINLESMEKQGVFTPYAQYEFDKSIYEEFVESGTIPDWVTNPKNEKYTYENTIYYTRTRGYSAKIGYDGNILCAVSSDDVNGDFIFFQGAMAIYGFGVRPCIWISK